MPATAGVLSLLAAALMCLTGCASALTVRTHHPTHVEILFSEQQRTREVEVWSLDSEATIRLADLLRQGEFPIQLLENQTRTTSLKHESLVVTAPEMMMGLGKRLNREPLPQVAVVLRFADEPLYRVLILRNAEWSEQYDVETDGEVKVLELITGYPRVEIHRSRGGDSVVWHLDQQRT